MGKTLVSYFKDFDADDIAQFYIQSEVPTLNICKNYYRVTDKDVLKSLFGCKTGCVLHEEDIETGKVNVKTYTDVEAKLHRRAGKRTPMTYLLRNALWKFGHWNNKKLKQWVDEFDPECVFFVSGDYAFTYKIALNIAKTKNIPLYVSCMDDYYINNNNKGKFLGEFQHKIFMRSVNAVMHYASAIFCICDAMSDKYSELFGKKCVTIHTAASFAAPLECSNSSNRIAYIGGLSYNRHLQLADIGSTLKKFGMQLDVYALPRTPDIQKYMTEEYGIVFHGSISSDEVKKVTAQSMAVIHTESFDDDIKDKVKYSVSTKIADSLMSGICIFAYGPSDIASINYLKENEVAICVTSKEDLYDGIDRLINDETLRSKVISNAIALANKNHHPGASYEVICNTITDGRQNEV